MEYHIGGNIMIDSYTEVLDRMTDNSGVDTDRHEFDGIEIQDEAGNISSALSLKKHNDIIRYGKDVLRARSVEDKLHALARQNVALGSLALMAVAVSGDKSFMSNVAQGATMRNI